MSANCNYEYSPLRRHRARVDAVAERIYEHLRAAGVTDYCVPWGDARLTDDDRAPFRRIAAPLVDDPLPEPPR